MLTGVVKFRPEHLAQHRKFAYDTSRATEAGKFIQFITLPSPAIYNRHTGSGPPVEEYGAVSAKATHSEVTV